MPPGRDPRCVFDTNVLISALLFARSTPARAFAFALDHGTVLVSLPLLQEVQAMLGRPKFERYVTPRGARAVRGVFGARGGPGRCDVTTEVQEHRDPKDDRVLELAVSGRAACIVSGDADLHALHPFRGIPIAIPSAFLADYAAPDEPAP